MQIDAPRKRKDDEEEAPVKKKSIKTSVADNKFFVLPKIYKDAPTPLPRIYASPKQKLQEMQ